MPSPHLIPLPEGRHALWAPPTAHPKWVRLFILLACWRALTAPSVSAQTAQEFFNSGAQFYISNNIPAALEKTEAGLKLYPDDVKLKKLEELLKQQQQQQQQRQRQNQQNQSGQSPPQNQSSPPQQNSSSQNQSSPKQNSPTPAPQPQAASGPHEKEKASPETHPAQEMTPEEAERLLDAQKDNEQVLSFQPRGKPENSNQPVKDW
jgi:hypothetical protein